jgi:hypothetical protein
MIRFYGIWLLGLLLILFSGGWSNAYAGGFAHPGLLHSRGDLERMKSAVAAGREPIAAGFEKFRSSPASQANYRMRGPYPEVARSPNIRVSEYDSDANAAYQCAIMWCITGDPAYAEKSKEIIRAWCGQLKVVSGVDAILMAGLGPFKMINAAEIIRHTDAGWEEADIVQSERHFREVIYPVIETFAPFANGNWDTAAMKTMMAIAIYCDDRVMLERVLRYYVKGHGNGRLTHYIINEAGQCQESGRDQGHTQLGLAHLGDCCEMAWNQGLDLYGYADNLLLRGFEYTAKYNLGESVPFAETLDRTGKYHHTSISPQGRGNLRAVFEQVYNHYANRAAIPAPFTQRAAESIRPEGAGTPGADHVGFGTLLFTQVCSDEEINGDSVPSAPGGLAGDGSEEEIEITWVAAVGARYYSVKRAMGGGNYEIIAPNIPKTGFVDTAVEAGKFYRYVVSALNNAGESADSQPFALSAGLPVGWEHQDMGPVGVPGSVSYDGERFIIEAGGKDLGGTGDQGHFVSQTLEGDGSIIARFVPQPSSQSSRFGLMVRDGVAADAVNVALLVGFESDGPSQKRAWRIGLSSRDDAVGGTTILHAGVNLVAPPVLHGRMTGDLWMKVQREGDAFTGLFSLDGISWTPVGAAELALPRKVLVGMVACSGLDNITTTIMFDHVAVASGGELPVK